jgi:hypothetical protein
MILSYTHNQVFYEPQTSSDVETVLRDYGLAISSVCLIKITALMISPTQPPKTVRNPGRMAPCSSLLSAGSSPKVGYSVDQYITGG